MPKAILEFNLPEEREEYEDAINGAKHSLIASELDEYLRQQLKYNNQLTEVQIDTYQAIRDKLCELRNDYLS